MVVTIIFLSCVVLVSAEHSGAYSSPQYAKKMFPKGYDTNALLPREEPPIPFKHNSIDRFDDRNDTEEYGRSSFMDTASDFLSGTGGELMTGLMKDFVARSTGSSQVLSLNLTNLVILIVLKALILAAGFFGAGAWKGHNYARSLDDNKNATFMTEDEVMLYLSFLVGQQTKDFGCLYKLSCKRPHQAGLYYSGADLLLQGAKLMQGNSLELEPYEEVSKGIKEAAQWGESGQSCDTRYHCGE